MNIEVRKEYITKNGFVARINLIENNLAYASILGAMIDEQERRRVYLLDGQDVNNEAFNIDEEDTEQWYRETSYLRHTDMPKRLELMPDILFSDYEREKRTLPKAFEMKYEEENKSVMSKFMQEFMHYLRERDKKIHQPDELFFDRFETEPKLPEMPLHLDAEQQRYERHLFDLLRHESEHKINSEEE